MKIDQPATGRNRFFEAKDFDKVPFCQPDNAAQDFNVNQVSTSEDDKMLQLISEA